MNIAILSRKTGFYSTQRLAEEATRRGHQARVIAPESCYLKIDSQNPALYCRGARLEDFDAVIPRFGASISYYGAAVVRQFEMMKVYVLNSAEAITRARDKLLSLQLLAQHGIAVPLTGFAHSPEDIQDMLTMTGGAPVVIKRVEGMKGVGVVLADTHIAAESVMEAFFGLGAHVVAQEFIKEAEGADIRGFVIGERVVAAMKRQARAGEFRSNLHRGGSAEAIELSAEERELALRAARIVGLDVAGVDMLRSHRGPLVTEVNASPGLEGIEETSGENIAGMIIEFLEKQQLLHYRLK